ncbi:MAG: type II toxin-antitoxin system RelE/ParE family toxin [Acidobacteriota bacterium]
MRSCILKPVREELKPVEWMGDSLERVRSFSKTVRQQVGYELELVQHGLEPSDWKPMPTVGPGVCEIRIHGGGEYRVVYVAKFRHAVYVLHAFQKKTRKTSKGDIGAARSRLQAVFQVEVNKK